MLQQEDMKEAFIFSRLHPSLKKTESATERDRGEATIVTWLKIQDCTLLKTIFVQGLTRQSKDARPWWI